MSDFKKLPCATNCPTPTGLIDCDGAPINVGDAVLRCGDIPETGPAFPEGVVCYDVDGVFYSAQTINRVTIWQDENHVDVPAPDLTNATITCCPFCDATDVTVTNTVAGNRIATITIDGVPTDIKQTLTTLEAVDFDEATRTLSVTYKGEDGVSVTKQENIPAIDAVVHIGPDVITPPTKYPQYYNTIVSDGNGNFWAFSIDGTPTPLNFIETITTLVDVLTYANKHEIFKYKNESGSLTPAYETVTTLKSLSYAKATNILTVVYTDENGTDITKTAEIKDLTNVFINGANPNSATIFSTTTPPSVNDNTLKQGTDYIYVGTDGSYWIWNGTAYVTAPVPAATTEWNVAGTNVDAKGDKVNRISRSGWVTIGKNVVPGSPLDVYNVGTNIYSVLARFLNPDNKIAGNNTQLIFGAAQESGNAADWRFYFSANNSTSNRIDFGFSGYAAPMITYTVGYRVGIRTTAPNSTLHVNGSFATPIALSPGAVTLGEFNHTVILSSPGTNQNLPSASGIDGRIYIIKNSSGGNITVTGLIESGTSNSRTIPSRASRTFQAFGGQWWIIGGYL